MNFESKWHSYLDSNNRCMSSNKKTPQKMSSNKNKSKVFCSERTANTRKQEPLQITSETSTKKSKQSLMASCLAISRSNDLWQQLTKTSKWVRTWNCNRSSLLLSDLIPSMNLNHPAMFSHQTARDWSKRRKQSPSSPSKRFKKPMRTSSRSKQRKMTTGSSNTLGGIRSRRS